MLSSEGRQSFERRPQVINPLLPSTQVGGVGSQASQCDRGFKTVAHFATKAQRIVQYVQGFFMLAFEVQALAFAKGRNCSCMRSTRPGVISSVKSSSVSTMRKEPG